MTRATRIFIVGVILACAAYDVIAIAVAGVPASISAAMLTVGTAHPILPFTWGGLSTHFFWPRRQPLAGIAWSIVQGALALAAVVACLVDLLHVAPAHPSPVEPALALLSGIVAGHVVFAQEAA